MRCLRVCEVLGGDAVAFVAHDCDLDCGLVGEVTAAPVNREELVDVLGPDDVSENGPGRCRRRGCAGVGGEEGGFVPVGPDEHVDSRGAARADQLEGDAG